MIDLDQFVTVEGATFGDLMKAVERAERGERVRFVNRPRGIEIFLAPAPDAPVLSFTPRELWEMDRLSFMLALVGMHRVTFMIRTL